MPGVPACYCVGFWKLDLSLGGDEESPMTSMDGVDQDVIILEPLGRLDSTTAQEFGDRLMALVHAGRSAIVVDLKNIAYISSAGFHVLLIANRATAEKQGKMALCGVNGDVKRMFDIGSLTELFLICQTQADGIAKLE
jgi:anti-sigma B factor antagonist